MTNTRKTEEAPKSADQLELERVRAEREAYSSSTDMAALDPDDLHQASRTLQSFDRAIETLEMKVAQTA